MWILINGIVGGASGDSFRIEVVTHVEYIPTLPFSTWSPTEATKVTESQVGGLLKEIAGKIPDVISGDVGRVLSGAYEVGRKMYETYKLASVLM